MKYNKKYAIGQIYDVWWEIVKIEITTYQNRKFSLKNKKTGVEVTVSASTMQKIAEGKTSVSKQVYIQHYVKGKTKDDSIRLKQKYYPYKKKKD